MSVFRKILAFVLVVIIFLGVFLRLHYGFSTDLWGDEAISFFIAKNTSWFDLIFSGPNYYDTVHPPFYYLFLKFFLIISNHDIYLRAISLILFFPSAYLVWLIGRQIGDKTEALFALALFSTHPLLVNLSFQVRSYSLTMFLVLVSIYEFILQLKAPSSTKGILLGITLSLSFWTSYASIWLIIGLFLFLLMQILKHGKKIITSFIPTILVFIFLSIFQFFKLLSALFAEFVAGSVIAGSVFSFNWQWFLQELELLTGLQVGFFSLFVLIIVPCIFLQRNREKISYLMTILFVGSIFLSALFSIFSSPIFLARQLLVSAIALVFIIAKLATNTKSVVFILLVLCTYTYLSLQTYGFLFQTNINQKVQQYVQNGDLILIFEKNHDYLDYYLFVNKKQAEVRVLSMNQLYNQKLLTTLEQKYQRAIFFTHYCPEEKYNDCNQIVEDLQSQFCNNIFCKTVE